MAQIKKSVTLDADIVSDIEQLVGPRGFSAFMNESARLRLLVEHTREAVREFEDAHGAIPAADLEAVDRAWPA